MHSERVRLWNHPPHDLDSCLDRAALLTQEGRLAGFGNFRVTQQKFLAVAKRLADTFVLVL